jgi:hypothetical protein
MVVGSKVMEGRARRPAALPPRRHDRPEPHAEDGDRLQGHRHPRAEAFRRERLLDTVGRCVVDKDLFASEFVIRAGREGKRVVEIPLRVAEKRKPSINLFKRVPNVLKNMAKLTWVIRVRHR